VELETLEKDPLESLRDARRKVLDTIRAEIGRVVAWLAQKQGLDVVFNDARLPLVVPGPGDLPAARAKDAPFQADRNPYDLFLTAPLEGEGKGPSPQGISLLSAWHDSAPRVMARLPDVGQQGIVYGGTDLTWPVLEILLRKYKVDKARAEVLKAYVERFKAR
jgi:hypothetical protein